MALPKLESPTYELELPSTQKKIKYRPFLVKEQKILLMAQESEDEKQIQNSISELVTSCTFGKIDTQTTPIFDIEYIFLKLRGKSVGEKIELSILCPDDEKTRIPIKINLEDINVQMTVGHTNEVKLTEDITVYLTYPTVESMNLSTGAKDTDVMFKVLNTCVSEIHWGDKIYHQADFSDKELTEFFEQFTMDQMNKVLDFFNSMPKLRHVISVVNPKTKVKSEVTLEGLNSFLG